MIKKFRRHIFDVAIVAAIFATGLAYYGGIYKHNEKKFSFYQKYFFSAVNIYCLKDPDIREYDAPETLELNERIDLVNFSCDELRKSSKVEVPSRLAYFNGWHDTHPILSTLIGYNWRLAGFTWEALWPIVGSLAALTVLAFYAILRCFGLPWYAALLLFPVAIPFSLLEQNFFFPRDFSKVPFILVAFALLGILFKPGLTYRARLLALSLSTTVIAVGVGFRQDSVVLMPAILAGAAFTSSIGSRKGILHFLGDVAAIFSAFILTGLAVDLLRTSQVAQLQGYPHFIVQGFADDFWKAAHAQIAGISFLTLYSDMIAYGAVDANTLEKVRYFILMDSKYTTSGFNLILKYSSLSAADMATRVFSGLSAVSHSYWVIQPVGVWLGLLLLLVYIGEWRLGFFLMFTILSLAAAGSIQFSPRHMIHFIMLDRVLFVIVFAAFVRAVWRAAIFRLDTKLGFALGTGAAGALIVVVLIAGGHIVQQAKLTWVKSDLEALPWFPSQEAYRKRFPNHVEVIERFTIDPGKCAAATLEAVVEVEGQRWARPLDVLDGTPRSVYFAVFDPAIVKMTVDVVPRECVNERAWGPLGDGSIPPLQFFDPEAALKKQSIMRHLGNIVSSFL